MRRPFVSGKLTRSQMAMEGSPYLAEVMRRPAFLWEYSGRFRNAMDNNNLTPEFVEGGAAEPPPVEGAQHTAPAGERKAAASRTRSCRRCFWSKRRH